jgi:hypothetical protein
MSSKPGPLGGAYRRPRIHLWPSRVGASWSIGPNGMRSSSLSAGEALEAALDCIEHRAAVIIYEAAP